MKSGDNMVNNGIIDPINHRLTTNELKSGDFSEFLNTLTDVPSSIPLRPYTISKAGITDQYVYIQIRSLNSKKFVPVYCNVTMQVELAGHRGIHMSRCEEALFELVQEKHESLDEFALKLAKELQKRQASSKAYVYVEGQYVYERKTVKTKLITYDRMTLFAEVSLINKLPFTRLGISVFNMTGCPCTETYTKFSVVPELKNQGFSLSQIQNILDVTNSGTHTQRGIATLWVDKTNSEINYKKLYSILQDSCHLVFELLKRPDEHELVLRALKQPQFTEDVVREIISNTIKTLRANLTPKTRIVAKSLLFDSIHIHDVCTEIDQTYEELTRSAL